MNKELEEKVAQATRIQEERKDVEAYFHSHLDEWLALQYQAELIGWDDWKERYYVYDGPDAQGIRFTGPAINDYSFQDSLILDEVHVHLPYDFIENGSGVYLGILKEQKKELDRQDRANRARTLRQQADKAEAEARRLLDEADHLSA